MSQSKHYTKQSGVKNSLSILDKKIMARLGVQFFSILPILTQNCEYQGEKRVEIILGCLKNIKFNNKKYIYLKKQKRKKKLGWF